MPDQRIVFVHAHPDDETIQNGASLAKYAAEGAHVCLVTCTLGEEGEVIPPELAHLSGDSLGQYRIGELAAACAALGVTDQRFLGGAGRWRDSGMMGLPSNDEPDSFWRADLDEAAAELVRVLRDVRPQTVVTYDDNGFYGHPDHIQAHRVAVRAVELAADPAHGDGESWRVDRFYATAMPVSVLEDALAELSEGPFDDVATVADFGFGVPDDQVTTRVDAAAYLPAKLAALRAHRTQISVDDPFFALSNNVGQRALGTEYYTLLQGPPNTPHTPDRESSLFG